MESYTDALNKELKPTTLDRSFIRANEETLKKDEVCSNILSLTAVSPLLYSLHRHYLFVHFETISGHTPALDSFFLGGVGGCPFFF